MEVNTKDAENVIVTNEEFEHALTYDIKPVRLSEHTPMPYYVDAHFDWDGKRLCDIKHL